MTDDAAPRPKRVMPKGGRISREERHARRVAEAYRRFEESLPDMLDKIRERVLAKDTPPGVFVQSLGTLDKMLSLLPKPAVVTDQDHMDAQRINKALNRVLADPARFIVKPVDLDTIEAEHARYDQQKAALEAKIEEVRKLKAIYLEEMETRPLGCPAPAPIVEVETPPEPGPPAQAETNPSTEEAIGPATQPPVPPQVPRAPRRQPPDDDPPPMLTDFRRERF